MVRKTSEPTWEYNCIAWAFHEDDRWWWPDPAGISYWPKGVSREVTLDAFIAASETRGFEVCLNADNEPGFEKVVLYAKGGVPTHAARQLLNGNWTSKLGREIDVQHNTPEALVDEIAQLDYGRPITYLRRRRPE